MRRNRCRICKGSDGYYNPILKTGRCRCCQIVFEAYKAGVSYTEMRDIFAAREAQPGKPARHCPVCGRKLNAQSRKNKVYCSAECVQKSYYLRRAISIETE